MNSKNSKKFRIFIKFSYFIIIFIFLFSIKTIAQEPPQYEPAPIGSPQYQNTNTNLSVSCAQYKYPWCEESSQNPAGLVKNFYLIALGLATAAAMGVLIYGGVLWSVSGAIATKKDAMDWITGAIWGLVLLLAAYLILYTINPNLVNLINPNEAFKPITFTPPADTSSDAQVRETLSGTNITVNGPQSQTNLSGLRSTTISGLTGLSNSCGGCNIQISGGTESGHEPGTFSHTNGYKLDLTPSTALDNVIYNRIATSCRIPPSLNTNCAGMDGNTYRYEPNSSGNGHHWDVCFQCRRN